jgi:hypothetical protein
MKKLIVMSLFSSLSLLCMHPDDGNPPIPISPPAQELYHALKNLEDQQPEQGNQAIRLLPVGPAAQAQAAPAPNRIVMTAELIEARRAQRAQNAQHVRALIDQRRNAAECDRCGLSCLLATSCAELAFLTVFLTCCCLH